MSAFTHTVSTAWSNGSKSISKTVSLDGDTETNLDVIVPDGTTDQAETVSIDVSELLSVFIVSNVDVTLETNDGTTPDDTIPLKAGIPYLWQSGGYFTNLLTADVTAFYFTNASGQQARIQLRFLFA